MGFLPIYVHLAVVQALSVGSVAEFVGAKVWADNETSSFAASIGGACDGDRWGVDNGFHGYFAHEIAVFEPKHKFEDNGWGDSEDFVSQEFVGADIFVDFGHNSVAQNLGMFAELSPMHNLAADRFEGLPIGAFVFDAQEQGCDDLTELQFWYVHCLLSQIEAKTMDYPFLDTIQAFGVGYFDSQL
ncbi:MAG: hypothetical protein GY938_16420, partial [Ketobacter sp.]|nr:hypothetical protein [Ketobacter sp.]